MMLIIAPLMFYEGSKTSLKKVRKNFRGIFFSINYFSSGNCTFGSSAYE